MLPVGVCGGVMRGLLSVSWLEQKPAKTNRWSRTAIGLYGDRFQTSAVRLTTMRRPLLALYIMGSCPALKSTAFSLPGWISILMLGIITGTF